MKNSLIRKLALSAATLALTALTAVSSTYAWFVTNATATASNLTGTVKSAGGNLMIGKISGDNNYSYSKTQALDNVTSWTTKLTLDKDSDALLQPVTYDANVNAFKILEAGKNTTVAADDTMIVRQTVWFSVDSLPQNENGYTLTVKMSGLAQDPSTGKNQTLAVSDVKDTSLKDLGVSARTIQLTDVLACKITSVALPDGVSDSGAGKSYKWSEEKTDTGDAVIYYNNIYGLEGEKALVRPESTNFETTYLSDTTDTALDLVTLNGFADAETNALYQFGITFEFYIDGWDYQCYNAVGGQKFDSLALEFNLSAK